MAYASLKYKQLTYLLTYLLTYEMVKQAGWSLEAAVAIMSAGSYCYCEIVIRQRRLAYHAEKADAFEARAAATEKAEDRHATAYGDDGDRQLIDGEYGTGRNAPQQLNVERRLAICSHPYSQSDQRSTE